MPRARAGLDHQDHEQEGWLFYSPRQQPSHTHHHQEALSNPFPNTGSGFTSLALSQNSPSLPKQLRIQCGFFGYVTNFLQAFSRVICSFSQMPLSPRATETSSYLIWCPRLLPVGIFLTGGPGTRVGRRPRSVYIGWERGGKSRTCWASSITGPAPSMVSGDLLLVPYGTHLYGNTSA